MNIRHLAKRIATLAVALSMAIPSTAFAAETTEDTNVNVPSIEQAEEDYGIDLCSTFNPAWKAVDSTTSEVNLRIWIIDENTGKKVFEDLFTPSRDKDNRKDDAGYWYAESNWAYNKLTYGHSYRFYYDITTAAGSTPTGNVRQALCHIWFNLK